MLGPQPHVAVHFALLTLQTFSCPHCHIFRQAGPYIPGADEVVHRLAARVGGAVEMVKYLMTVWQRDQGPERAGQHVPPQFQIAYLFKTNFQARLM
jgi:hypothetical protein